MSEVELIDDILVLIARLEGSMDGYAHEYGADPVNGDDIHVIAERLRERRADLAGTP